MKPAIKVKRIYEATSDEDGFRVLIDRLWPRGMKKENAHIDVWRKDFAPSNALRTWYGHVVDRWPEFQKKYKEELKLIDNEIMAFLNEHKFDTTITLLYGAKDELHNQAIVLQAWMQKHN